MNLELYKKANGLQNDIFQLKAMRLKIEAFLKEKPFEIEIKVKSFERVITTPDLYYQPCNDSNIDFSFILSAIDQRISEIEEQFNQL